MGPPELQSFIFWVEILRLKLEPKSWDWSRHESLVQWISATSATVGLQVFCYDFFIFGYANVRFLMGNPSSEHPLPLGLDDKNLSKNIVYKRRPFSTKG